MGSAPTVTRDQLFEAVWSTPIVQLAKRYGLSDVGLAKVCRRHQIPRPGVGYWAKRQHGQDPPRPELPTVVDASLQIVDLVELDELDLPDEPERFAQDDEVNDLIIAERRAPKIAVPATLRDPHPIVSAIMRSEEARDALERQRDGGRHQFQTRIRPSGAISRGNFSVSKPLRSRACRVMSALLRAAEERGFAVSGQPDNRGRPILVEVLGEIFDVRIYEPVLQRPHVLTKVEQAHRAKYPAAWIEKHDYVPSGKLCLQLRPERGYAVYWQCRDGQRARIENRLNDVFIAALRRVDEDRAWRREHQRAAARAAEAERQRRAEAERKRAAEEDRKREQARVDSLLEEVEDWRRSRALRAYLRRVRRVLAEEGKVIEPGSPMDVHLQWAASVADRLDPLFPPPSDTPPQ